MKAGGRIGRQEEEEDDEEDFLMKKDAGGPSSSTTNNNTSSTKRGGKINHEKANAIRSKHSVTEQRRRSKINERFQILRDLIPHSDQKRDTASFLLEVIEYVQYLQEKVQKYEGSYQGWTQEPTKLMPWRNSHWRVQNFVGQPQPIKNNSGLGSTFSGKFDENNIAMTPTMLTNAQNPLETDPGRISACKSMDEQPELASKATALPLPLQQGVPPPTRSDGMLIRTLQGPVSDAQLADCPISNDTLGQQDDLVIEGGTIGISSVYSQGLLNSLTEALHGSGVDLSQASVSVQINLGKRANKGLALGTSKDFEDPASGNQHGNNGDDSNKTQKRLKI
ncbi:Myc-type, basic helix-loop-helix (bHLH) domain [Dillenia turbinata]|uniref:Myc-type, basic helix-loop-helix (BHLH) domain n=1 Tax=Dillenia turbinata TaxID=194707 RepID=A0AAN8Z605_9MAGN